MLTLKNTKAPLRAASILDAERAAEQFKTVPPSLVLGAMLYGEGPDTVLWAFNHSLQTAAVDRDGRLCALLGTILHGDGSATVWMFGTDALVGHRQVGWDGLRQFISQGPDRLSTAIDQADTQTIDRLTAMGFCRHMRMQHQGQPLLFTQFNRDK